jgi:hypothetical protein
MNNKEIFELLDTLVIDIQQLKDYIQVTLITQTQINNEKKYKLIRNIFSNARMLTNM